MNEGRRPSKADQALIDALEEAGFSGYSGRTIESWREEGVLPKTEQRWLGRPHGSTSVYSPEAIRQGLALAGLLKRHRSFDKAATLLWLHGYDVEPERIRGALLAGLDHLGEQIDTHATGDPDATADAMAEAILSGRLRSKEERAWRRQQIRQAGGREQLKKTYAGLARPMIGGANLGGFLAAYKTIGQDFRQMLGLDEQAFRGFEARMDANFADLNAAGGMRRFLQDEIPGIPPEGLDRLRGFLRETRIWMAGLGISWSPPGLFLADVDEALLQPAIQPSHDRADTPDT